jgi:hypothetical protein
LESPTSDLQPNMQGFNGLQGFCRLHEGSVHKRKERGLNARLSGVDLTKAGHRDQVFVGLLVTICISILVHEIEITFLDSRDKESATVLNQSGPTMVYERAMPF